MSRMNKLVKKVRKHGLVGSCKMVPKVIKYQFYIRNKKSTERNEADYIWKRFKAADFDEAIVVYDMKVSAPSYGEVFNVVMVARLFLIMGKKVKFFIVNSEFREDTQGFYIGEECQKLVLRLAELPEVILKDANCEVQIMSWGDMSQLMGELGKDKKTLVLYRKKVKKREPLYKHCYNMINYLVSYMDRGQITRFLLDKNEICRRVNIKFPPAPYITWNARYSEKWDFYRNIDEKEFIEIYRSLRALYPRHDIMVVSDEIGCEYYKKVAKNNDLPCLFSKDYSSTFMGDCALVIGSDYFFSVRGGGIGLAAIYSAIPYYAICEVIHEIPWKEDSFVVWAHDKQIWKRDVKGLPTDAIGDLETENR
jgi:hypothetical protein